MSTPCAVPHALIEDLHSWAVAGRFICLYPHVQADGDALGACLGLARYLHKLGARVAIRLEEAMPTKLKRALEPGLNESWFEVWPRPARLDSVPTEALALCLDCSPGSRLGQRQQAFERAPLRWVIDHHQPDAQPWQAPGLRVWRETGAAATCEMITLLMLAFAGATLPDRPSKGSCKPAQTGETLPEARVMAAATDPASLQEMTPEIARPLLVGLLTDTGQFAHTNTLPRTLKLAAWLVEAGAPLHALIGNLFQLKTRVATALMGYVAQNTRYLAGGQAALCLLPRTLIDQLQPEGTDYEGLAVQMRDVERVKVAVLLRPMCKKGVKGSVRSTEAFDAQAFCAEFGGGGHLRAAGFSLPGLREAEALAKVEAALLKHLGGSHG